MSGNLTIRHCAKAAGDAHQGATLCEVLGVLPRIAIRRLVDSNRPFNYRIKWARRCRAANVHSVAIFDSSCGGVLIHEPVLLARFLGLSGRAKPRAGCQGRAPAVPGGGANASAAIPNGPALAKFCERN